MANGILHDPSKEHPWLWLLAVLAVSIPPTLVGLALYGTAGDMPGGMAARIAAIVAGAVAVTAVYWAGWTLGGSTMAVLSALTVGTTWYFQLQVCLAAYDIHCLAWGMVAMASALWAIAPFASPPGTFRRVIGWGLAAVTLSVASLLCGPIALALALPALLVIVLLVGSDRQVNLWALLVMAMVSMALATTVMLLTRSPETGQSVVVSVLTQTVLPTGEVAEGFGVWWWSVALVAAMFPWTLWLLGGLTLPFGNLDAGPRRWLLVPWMWFMLVLVTVCVAQAGQPRILLALLPPAGLLVGLMWSSHQWLAERGERASRAAVVCLPHWAALIAVSLVAGPLLLGQSLMVDYGWVQRMPIGPVVPSVAVVGGGLLTALALFGAWQHAQWYPRRAGLVTGVWSALLLAMIWHAYEAGQVEAIDGARDEVAVRASSSGETYRGKDSGFDDVAAAVPEGLAGQMEEHVFEGGPTDGDTSDAVGESGSQGVDEVPSLGLLEADQSIDRARRMPLVPGPELLLDEGGEPVGGVVGGGGVGHEGDDVTPHGAFEAVGGIHGHQRSP